MSIDEFISLATNVGFPVAVCFILLRYMLQTMGEKLDKLDNSLNRLTKVIRELDSKSKGKNEYSSKVGVVSEEEREKNSRTTR